MVSPIELLVVALVVTVSAVVAALWRWRLPTAPESLPRPDEAAGQGPDPGSADAPVGRNLRGVAIALALMPLSSWLALSFAYGYSERPLPVKPPGPASDCGHSSSGDGLLWLAVIAVLVLLQFGPSLVGFLVGRRRAAANRPLPDGQRFLRFGAALAGATLLAVVLRLAVGGVAPSAFTTYGALTPPGARGWRAEAVIHRQVGTPATWWALQEGAPLPCDTKRSDGHLSMGSYEVPGLKAWIADAPVNLVYTKGGRFSVQRVEESTVDPARRPRFDTPPKVARALAGARDRARNRWVLRAKQSDGSILAVMVDTSDLDGDVDLVGLGHREVGLLLQPPVASLLVGLCLMLLALPCFQAARRLTRRTDPRALAWASISRLGAACLLLEAAMVLYGAYRIYG